MSLQKKCFTASAITHGLLLLLVFIGSAFIPQKPQIKGPEFEIFTLPPDFELVAENNVFSGGSRDAAGGPKEKPIEKPQPVSPPPQPKPEPQKVEVPPIKPVEAKPEPVKQVETPKPKPEPDNFDFSKPKVVKPEPKKPEPTKFQDFSKAKTIKIPQESKTPSPSPRETQLAALRASEIAELKRNLEGNLSAGGKSGGSANVNDFLGPGGNRVASYSLYLAGVYRQAWVAPIKSSGKLVRVKVTISKDGTVLSREVLDKSGDRDFVRAAESTVNRVKKFDRPPPTNEPSVTYTLEFVPPE